MLMELVLKMHAFAAAISDSHPISNAALNQAHDVLRYLRQFVEDLGLADEDGLLYRE
jgi:hypothetical protein